MKEGRTRRVFCCLVTALIVLAMVGCRSDSAGATDPSGVGDQLQATGTGPELDTTGSTGEALTVPTDDANTTEETDAAAIVKEPTTAISDPSMEKPTCPTETTPKPSESTMTAEPERAEPVHTDPLPTEPKSTEPAHSHSYTAGTPTAPTCTADGYTTYTCSCGASYNSDAVVAIGHSWGAWQTTKEATTTAEGQQIRTCSACGSEETTSISKLPAEVIDTATLEEYGRSYAVNTYGYLADTSMGRETYCGYYPAVSFTITTMEEGRRAVESAVTATTDHLLVFGPIYEKQEDGTILRARINVEVVHSRGNTYSIFVFYG